MGREIISGSKRFCAKDPCFARSRTARGLPISLKVLQVQCDHSYSRTRNPAISRDQDVAEFESCTNDEAVGVVPAVPLGCYADDCAAYREAARVTKGKGQTRVVRTQSPTSGFVMAEIGTSHPADLNVRDSATPQQFGCNPRATQASLIILNQLALLPGKPDLVC